MNTRGGWLRRHAGLAFSLDDDGGRGPEFDHLRLIVDVGQRRLADVGNRESSRLTRRP